MASAAVTKDKLDFIISNLGPKWQHATGHPTWQPKHGARGFEEQRPSINGTISVSLQHFPGRHQEHARCEPTRLSIMHARAHTHTHARARTPAHKVWLHLASHTPTDDSH